MMPEYKWRPIEDIPEELYTYSDPDLRALENEWLEVRAKISDEVLERILTEIKREWAIETGKIEGLYTLSKGITKTLIQHGISAKLIPQDSTNLGPLQLTELLKDQQEVIEGLMDFVAQSKPLTLHYIRQMHQVFTRHQDMTEGITEEGALVNIPMIKGDWKKWPNNPLQEDKTIHEYCPPEQVSNEMERLLVLHQKHLEEQVSPELEAAFLHHRFTQIHPFQDGNGRIARALASLVFLQTGDFPFVVNGEERMPYIRSLEEADNNNLLPLITFMIEKQKNLLYEVLKNAQDVNYSSDLKILEKAYDIYLSDYETRKQQAKKVEQILNTWRDITKEIISLNDEKLHEKGFSEEPLLRKEMTTDFKVNMEGSLSGLQNHDVGVLPIYDFRIQFPFSYERILIHLSPVIASTGEIDLEAKIVFFPGEVFAFMKESGKNDYRRSGLNFRKWLMNEFGKLLKRWLNLKKRK